MMRVVFFDKMRETHYAVGGVIQLESITAKVNGRITNLWCLTMLDGKKRTFKQKDFTILRVEI